MMNDKNTKDELKKIFDTISLLKKRINILEHENKRLKSFINNHDYNIKMLTNMINTIRKNISE